MNAIIGVRAEVWPVAADSLGIWLTGADAWRSGLIDTGSEPHEAVTRLLAEHGETSRCKLVHSTSWRMDGESVILTYIAVLGGFGTPEWVADAWPAALPLTVDAATAAGRPIPHHAADAPMPRYLDVLMHGIRHLRFLLDTDASARVALDAHWTRALHELTPTLAGMYS